jgi:hypothetical protein
MCSNKDDLLDLPLPRALVTLRKMGTCADGSGRHPLALPVLFVGLNAEEPSWVLQAAKQAAESKFTGTFVLRRGGVAGWSFLRNDARALLSVQQVMSGVDERCPSPTWNSSIRGLCFPPLKVWMFLQPSSRFSTAILSLSKASLVTGVLGGCPCQ